MMLAATQPQAFASADFDLAALFVHSSASNPSGDALLDIFDGELRREPGGGIVYANSLGGPVGVYGSFLTKDEDDLISVAGPEGAAQLTLLLNSSAHRTAGDGTTALTPANVASEFYSTPNSNVLNVFADPATMNDHLSRQNSERESRPTIDEHGDVDCAGALTCNTDPSTNSTTVTYPDGVVAVVQKVNNLTVVAYNAIRDVTLGTLERLRPPTEVEASAPRNPAPSGVGATPPVPQAQPDATPDLALAPPTLNESEPAPTVGSATPGDTASHPAAVLAARAVESRAKRGPLLNVLRPARDFTPWRASRPTAAVRGMTDLSTAVNSALSDVAAAVQNVLSPRSASVGTNAADAGSATEQEPSTTSDVSNPPSSPTGRSGLRSADESRTSSPSARRNGTGSQSSSAPGRRAADSAGAGPARRHH